MVAVGGGGPLAEPNDLAGWKEVDFPSAGGSWWEGPANDRGSPVCGGGAWGSPVSGWGWGVREPRWMMGGKRRHGWLRAADTIVRPADTHSTEQHHTGISPLGGIESV